MRSRGTIVTALLLISTVLGPAAAAAQMTLHLEMAQPAGGGGTQGDDEGDPDEAGTQGEDAEEGEGDTGAAEETGPPWTYQMARIGAVLLLLLGLAIGWMYYKLVARRQRGLT